MGLAIIVSFWGNNEYNIWNRFVRYLVDYGVATPATSMPGTFLLLLRYLSLSADVHARRFTSFLFISKISNICTFLFLLLCFLLLWLDSFGAGVLSLSKKQESVKGMNDLSNVINHALKVSGPLNCKCKISIVDPVTMHFFVNLT